MVVKENRNLSLTKQCELAGVSSSTMYYKPRPERAENIELMNRIDELYTRHPYYGARRIQKALSVPDHKINIKRIRRLMKKMGILAIYPKKDLSKPAPAHKKYPYLLRGLDLTGPNHVWSMDITYVKMRHGYLYLTAVMDWYSRKVLSWKTSNTMTIEFCRSCLQEAIDQYGTPQIFNTDQGSQFTSTYFTSTWDNHPHVQISMDGRGRATDNAFIERLWRNVKQECTYLHCFEDGASLWIGLAEYFEFYNHHRLHQGLGYLTPHSVYEQATEKEKK